MTDTTQTPVKHVWPSLRLGYPDTQCVLAFLLNGAFIAVIFVWIFHPPAADAASTAVLNTLVGTLGGMAGMVDTFYFGSSKGSKDKDDTISSALETATTK